MLSDMFINNIIIIITHTTYFSKVKYVSCCTTQKFRWEFHLLTGAVYHHGVPSGVSHTASSHHTGGSLHRHHGEGKCSRLHYKLFDNLLEQCAYVWIMNAYLILCMIQSWWVWDGTEHSDLWYNCRFDNETEAWFCASSEDTGKAIHLST